MSDPQAVTSLSTADLQRYLRDVERWYNGEYAQITEDYRNRLSMLRQETRDAIEQAVTELVRRGLPAPDWTVKL